MKISLSKNLFYGTVLAFGLTSLATACKKDKEPELPAGGGGGGTSGNLKAMVDNVSFSSNPTYTQATRVAVGPSETITVQGSDDAGTAIILVMNGVDGEGTYAIGGGANISISASYVEANAANPSASQTWQAPFDPTEVGEVTISTLTSARIEGSFHFRARNNSDDSEVEVKEGSFNLDF